MKNYSTKKVALTVKESVEERLEKLEAEVVELKVKAAGDVV